MIILTERIFLVTEQVQNLCFFTIMLIFICDHGNLNLDFDQILMTTAITDGNHPRQLAE